MLHSNRFCVHQFPALTRRLSAPLTNPGHRSRGAHAPAPGPPHAGAPQAGEPAGHRLKGALPARPRGLAAAIHPAQLAHRTPIPATLLTHRTLMITLISSATATHPSRPV